MKLPIVLLVTTSLAFLPACGPQYKSKPLVPLQKQTASSEQTKNGITLRIKRLTKQDIHTIFDGRGSAFFNKTNAAYSIQPIQLTLSNKGNTPIIFNPTKTNLQLARDYQIIKALQVNTTSRMILLGSVCVLLTIASIPLSICAFAGNWVPLFTTFVLETADTAIYLTAGTVFLCSSGATAYHGYTLHRSNQDMAADLKNKVKNDNLTVNPGQEASIVLFASKESLKNSFTINVNPTDMLNSSIAFTLNPA